MMRNLIAFYSVRSYATTLVYMMQSVEYQPVPYLRWYWRAPDYSRVMYRRQLDKTKTAQLLLLALLCGMYAQYLVAFVFALSWLVGGYSSGIFFGLAALFSCPVVWAHLAAIPLALGRVFVTGPKEARLMEKSEEIFKNHPGIKIAVAGSYGKTSMKELLVTILSEGKKVAATPANKNVASSHAKFACNLAGDEDVLVIEYGEGKPGDVRTFAETTHPIHGIITGLAPAHLDQYKTLQAAGEDIFALADYLKGRQVYVNGESAAAKPFVKKSYNLYDATGALGWRADNIELTTAGTSFTLRKGKQVLKLHSGLLGKHQVGPLSLAAALALELGNSEDQVVKAVAKTVPYEHRMQPRQQDGAWIIDDTYNGNIEGVRVGTELLAALPAKRKLYVTPGLVEQGGETEAVHLEMGKLIASAKPDVVVLMQNSTTDYIRQGLELGKFGGEVRTETDPLAFYEGLEHQIAAGDLVLMQNDWTDNYA